MRHPQSVKELSFSKKSPICGAKRKRKFPYRKVSDIEEEINGLYTYDREVCKVNKERLKKLNRDLSEEYARLCEE